MAAGFGGLQIAFGAMIAKEVRWVSRVFLSLAVRAICAQRCAICGLSVALRTAQVQPPWTV